MEKGDPKERAETEKMLREKEGSDQTDPNDLGIDLVKGRTDHRMNSGTCCNLDKG